MNSIVITPKNKAEFTLINQMLQKMNIETQVLSDEAKEDLGMVKLMKEADRSKKVSASSIMKKLRGI